MASLKAGLFPRTRGYESYSSSCRVTVFHQSNVCVQEPNHKFLEEANFSSCV